MPTLKSVRGMPYRGDPLPTGLGLLSSRLFPCAQEAQLFRVRQHVLILLPVQHHLCLSLCLSPALPHVFLDDRSLRQAFCPPPL